MAKQKKTPEQVVEDRKKYYEGYYAKNREALNKKRREKYHADPERREAILTSTRSYRATHGRGGVPKGMSVAFLDGKKYQVYGIGVVAATLGVTPQRLRLLESMERIPCSVFPGFKRFYTEKQVSLIRAVIESEGGRAAVAKAFKNWKGGL